VSVLDALCQQTNHLMVPSFQLSPRDKWIKLALRIEDVTRGVASFILKLINLQLCKESISVAGVLCLLTSCVIICLECKSLGFTQRTKSILGWVRYYTIRLNKIQGPAENPDDF
jgi:hypothetical protein